VGVQHVVEIAREEVFVAGQSQERLERRARVHDLERSRQKLLECVVLRSVAVREDLAEPVQRRQHPVGRPRAELFQLAVDAIARGGHDADPPLSSSDAGGPITSLIGREGGSRDPAEDPSTVLGGREDPDGD
jgi:hypothetical protein